MSNYEWEHAEITLPSAEVAPLKKALREAHNGLREAAKVRAHMLHDQASTRSLKKYRAFLNDLPYPRSPSWNVDDRARLSYAAESLARSIVRAVLDSGAVRKPTDADVEKVIPLLTNRSTYIPAISHGACHEGSVTFSGRVLVWDVDENNHAVEHARESVVGSLLFHLLDRIEWTSGSGGDVTYNSENHLTTTPEGYEHPAGPIVSRTYRRLTKKERDEKKRREDDAMRQRYASRFMVARW